MLMSLGPITTWTNAQQTVFSINSGPVIVHRKRSCSLRRTLIMTKHLTNAIAITLV
ncbi:hypothetical protein Bca4012_059009 [Brassica carinata]